VIESFLKCRSTESSRPSVMEDARAEVFQIQETGQDQWPARMAGLTSLESIPFDMEVDVVDRTQLRRRGER
jgi:hypothetical protein